MLTSIIEREELVRNCFTKGEGKSYFIIDNLNIHHTEIRDIFLSAMRVTYIINTNCYFDGFYLIFFKLLSWNYFKTNGYRIFVISFGFFAYISTPLSISIDLLIVWWLLPTLAIFQLFLWKKRKFRNLI